MLTLEFAIDCARLAHKDQVDKAGQPYIEHCLRVMKAVEKYGIEVQIVAVLHDALEDTQVTVDYLRSHGASEAIIAAIESVTKRKGETYLQLVYRARGNQIGRLVKLADNLDNSDEKRLSLLPDAQAIRLRKKYTTARMILADPLSTYDLKDSPHNEFP